MPNWCDNRLKVTAWNESDYAVLKDFKEAFTDKFFEAHHPTPPKYLETDEWYDWRITNWGTKWNINDSTFVSISSDDDTKNGVFECVFDTAWSPPEEWLASVQEQYPTLFFELFYMEPGF